MRTIEDHAQALANGSVTSRDLVEASLARIADPAGQGGHAFIKPHAQAARAMADAMDALRRAGRAPSHFAGIPISVKDLFDIAGEVTTAGSIALKDAQPATTTAPAVARMLAAGFVPVGRTNMSEFAFSGLGLNPHYGTPLSPWRRDEQRAPGGSSSGAAVSVADGMAVIGLGTDTGGSCRIPAAFCGVVGYKPTARRVPLTGAVPLSSSLDSIGPFAPSVACAAIADAVLAGITPIAPTPLPLAGLRFAVPRNMVLEGMDAVVGRTFERALSRLAAAGATINHVDFPSFEAVAEANARATFPATEAYAWHRPLLAAHAEDYDPRVRARILRGEQATAAEYIDLLTARARLIGQFDRATAPFDAVLMPTAPIVPPTLHELAEDAEFTRINLLALRNNALGNFLDRCAISLPCHQPGEAPVGLMVMGETMGDARLFAIAAGVERTLSPLAIA